MSSHEEDFFRGVTKVFIEETIKATFWVAKRFAGYRGKKEEKRFSEARDFLVNKRNVASRNARYYYNDKQQMLKDIPVMYKKGWIPKEPINLLDKNKLNLELDVKYPRFRLENSIFLNKTYSPINGNHYSKMLNEILGDKIELFPAPIYRLLDISTNDNKINFKFSVDEYLNFIDNCEILDFELCRTLLDNAKNSTKLLDFYKRGLPCKLRDELDPFDFSNRSACVGINTFLIFIDKKKTDSGSKCFLHRRGKKVAEAINTIHVVPAGTFQQRHEGFNEDDFDFYRNIMREFGEELLGKKEFKEIASDYENILECKAVSGINKLIQEGDAKAYFLGIVLDCINIKPEILTVLVFDKQTKKGKKFKNNFEGKYMEADFSKKSLNYYIYSKDTLPACQACLYLVRENFEFFKHCLD